MQNCPFFRAVALVLLLSAVRVTMQAQSFSDSFNDPTYTALNWANDTGNWQVTGGTYNLGGHGNVVNISTVPSTASYANFTINTDLFNSGDSGLVVRSDVAGTNSLVLIARPSFGDFYFINRTPGGATGNGFDSVLATSSIGDLAVGTDLHLTLSATGNTFTASLYPLNNPGRVTTVTLTNSSVTAGLTAGRVGVYEYGGSPTFARYGNFSAVVPEPSTWVLCASVLAIGLGAFLRRHQAV